MTGAVHVTHAVEHGLAHRHDAASRVVGEGKVDGVGKWKDDEGDRARDRREDVLLGAQAAVPLRSRSQGRRWRRRGADRRDRLRGQAASRRRGWRRPRQGSGSTLRHFAQITDAQVQRKEWTWGFLVAVKKERAGNRSPPPLAIKRNPVTSQRGCRPQSSGRRCRRRRTGGRPPPECRW